RWNEGDSSCAIRAGGCGRDHCRAGGRRTNGRDRCRIRARGRAASGIARTRWASSGGGSAVARPQGACRSSRRCPGAAGAVRVPHLGAARRSLHSATGGHAPCLPEARMKRDVRYLVVAGAIACGGGPAPPGQSTPGTGAVTTVVPSETDARVSRVEELLRGVPGLEVTPLSNGSYQIRIRGQRSIRGNPGDDDPLIVIDGVPSSAGAAALADIAPSDVARIDVLKDAGTTSHYGSRGAA